VQPEINRQTVRLFEEQPEKAKSNPTLKVRTDGSQAVMEAGSFSWRYDLPEGLGLSRKAASQWRLP
jgi:hypothetical protein